MTSGSKVQGSKGANSQLLDARRDITQSAHPRCPQTCSSSNSDLVRRADAVLKAGWLLGECLKQQTCRTGKAEAVEASAPF